MNTTSAFIAQLVNGITPFDFDNLPGEPTIINDGDDGVIYAIEDGEVYDAR